MQSRFLLIFISIIAFSCRCDDFQEEPYLWLAVYEKDSLGYYNYVNPYFSKIYVQGYDKRVDATLPIDLNSNHTSYILVSNQQTDTLTIYYDKKYQYSERCSFTVDLENVKTIQPTTFDSVIVNPYEVSIYF